MSTITKIFFCLFISLWQISIHPMDFFAYINDPSRIAETNKRILSAAAITGRSQLVKDAKNLIQQNKIAIDTPLDNNGSTALLLISKYYDPYQSTGEFSSSAHFFDFLLRNKANINAKDNHKKTPLINAAINPNPPGALEILLKNKQKPNINDQDDQGQTALMYAVDNDFLHVKTLLDHGANTAIKNKDGNTALDIAHEKLKQLKEDALNQKPINAHRSINNYKEIIEILRTYTEPLTDINDLILLSNQLENLSNLVTKDKQPIKNEFEQFISLVNQKNIQEAQKLLGKFNINSQDKYGRTPLIIAAGSKQPALIQQLLTYQRINLDLSDNDGRTALIWASISGDNTTVKLLLDAGANLTLQDRYKHTALDYAFKLRRSPIIILLKDDQKVKEFST